MKIVKTTQSGMSYHKTARLQGGVFDPVNLSTGNFIYQKKDISIKGSFPLFFKRFYNAINRRSGALGPDWNHNYEVFMEKDEKKDVVTVILSDGREDIYRKAADGSCIPFRFCGSVLEKKAEGYLYTTKEKTRYLFDEEGRNIRQENMNGKGITLFYMDSESPCPTVSRQLCRVEEDSGNKLFFTYNEQGYLAAISDHAGRKISFAYQEGRFYSITDLLGGVTVFTYGKKGKIETITNPRGITSVTNQFDHRGRTVKQAFPDGGEMSYEYLDYAQKDKERTVILTEQNGNRIHYIHDGQNRHIKTIYTDAEGKPICEESYEYNSNNRRTKYVDRNGNKTRLKYSAGNVTEIVDPLRQRTGFIYNSQDKVIQIKQADGSRYYFEYDENGNLIKTTDPLKHEQIIRYENSLPVSICLPDGSSDRLVYDQRGNIVSIEDDKGNMTMI